MTKTALAHDTALTAAQAIARDLAPFCERLAIAGSLRRGTATSGDVEIVAIPRFEPAGLFGDQKQNALWSYLIGSTAYQFVKGDQPTNRYSQLRTQDGLQVDLFTTSAEAWGWIYLMRTGSALFGKSILSEWKRQQGLGKDQKGSVDGHLVDRYHQAIATPEEVDVFTLLALPFIPPRDRDDDALARTQRRTNGTRS